MVDIIPKQQETELSSIVLTIAVAVLIIAVGSFGVFFLLKERSEGKLEEATASLIEGKSSEQVRLESEILQTKTKLEDFSVLAIEKKNIAPFFAFVEENAHPGVVFSQLALNPRENKAVLDGEIQSFRNLQEQINLFREEGSGEVALTSISLGEAGQVRFVLSILFSQSFFTTQ